MHGTVWLCAQLGVASRWQPAAVVTGRLQTAARNGVSPCFHACHDNNSVKHLPSTAAVITDRKPCQLCPRAKTTVPSRGPCHLALRRSQRVSLQGLPTLTAPGEAEAAAGALNAAGHVDAAGTPDGDVLLFGATEVFHTLKLLVSKPHHRCRFVLLSC